MTNYIGSLVHFLQCMGVPHNINPKEDDPFVFSVLIEPVSALLAQGGVRGGAKYASTCLQLNQYQKRGPPKKQKHTQLAVVLQTRTPRWITRGSSCSSAGEARTNLVAVIPSGFVGFNLRTPDINNPPPLKLTSSGLSEKFSRAPPKSQNEKGTLVGRV